MSCPDCFRGGVTTSHPTGSEETIHGVKTYVAKPEEGVTPKGLIIYITDAFGWDFVNNRVLADHYAKRGGYLVYVPDFMNGKAMHPDALVLMDKVMGSGSWADTLMKPLYVVQAMRLAIPWMLTSTPPKTKAGVFSFVQTVRTSAPPFETDDLKVGVAGFCWGGKHCTWLAQDDPESRVKRHESQTGFSGGLVEPAQLIDCAFTAHPSFIEVPVDYEAVKLPLSVAIGETDVQMSAPKVQEKKKKMLKRKRKKKKIKRMLTKKKRKQQQQMKLIKK